MRLRLPLAVGFCLVLFAVLVPAGLAFDCAVAKKPATAGAVGIVNVVTGEFTPLKKNPGSDEHAHGAFVALTDGQVSTSTFLHAPGGVLPPVREGGPHHDCDGKGLESLEVCFSG